MNRTTKMIIFSIVLVFAIIQKQTTELDITNSIQHNGQGSDRQGTGYDETSDEADVLWEKRNAENNNTEDVEPIMYKDINIGLPIYYPTPKNGFSPYDTYFGKGIYNNSSGNSFKVENSNKTDAVVLLVNAFTGNKIRNEFVRKGATFEMTGVPNGTYYLEWFSGNSWSPSLIIGSKFKGGFQTNKSFTKTRDKEDWMSVKGYEIWTVTLYSVEGGDVASENINEYEFFN
ncbi:hypothetical protein N9454_05510 [Flavobacteriaceae bacterium]|nr:hypothetical protein [Flavobacteriaceae bacterium]